MEKSNVNAKETKEVTMVDVTKEVLPRLAKKYVNAIAKVIKTGSEYEITFANGYTIFGQTSRKVKNIPGIMWYSRIATEEKEAGKCDMEMWTKFFNENKIVWDGKNVPEYILTQEQIDGKKKEPKADKKAKSTKANKTEEKPTSTDAK